MTLEQYLLQCLGEEGIEIAHAVSKAVRFGLDDEWPGKATTNRQDIKQEFNDLLAVLEMLMEFGTFQEHLMDRNLIETKKDKIRKMLCYSKKRGKVNI